MEFLKQTYNNMLKQNIAPEMARMILPQNLYTEWYWSGTLMAFARVCNLRCKPDTQLETRLIAEKIHWIAKEKFPVSWKALVDIKETNNSFDEYGFYGENNPPVGVR
jgi:thymidylate synthase (FAD)